ncbi:MAG: MFS transporter [Granulosicoccus sp.]
MFGRQTSALTEETRVSTYYAVFFLAIGSVMPFVAIWFESIGISASMSGLILAAPPFAIVLFNIIIGSAADRLKDWRSAIIGCNIIALVVGAWLLFRVEPVHVLVVWTISGLFVIASSPITDAAALDMTRRRGSDYARIRALGSVGFVVGIVLAGALFDKIGMGSFAWIILLTAALRLLAAYLLPTFRERPQSEHQAVIPDDEKTSINQRLFGGLMAGMALFRQPGISSVIFGAALLNASHSFNNVYSVLHWGQLGISNTVSSLLWSAGVVAEIALMWGFTGIAKRVSARHCLLLACFICTVRWLITGMDPSVWVLFVLQTLHAITFGLTFLASVNFISRRVDADHAAQAQSVLATLTTLFMAIGIWLSGQFYQTFGGQTYWAMAIMALLGGALVLNSYRTKLIDVAAEYR